MVFTHDHRPSRHASSDFFGISQTFQRFVIGEAPYLKGATKYHLAKFLDAEDDSKCFFLLDRIIQFWSMKRSRHVMYRAHFAQSELGEIVYVEIDNLGEEVAKDGVFGTIEAVKTTSELYMPVSGEVLEFNPAISEDDGDDPALVNSDPYGEGWIVKIKLSNPEELDELMDAAAYSDMVS